MVVGIKLIVHGGFGTRVQGLVLEACGLGNLR